MLRRGACAARASAEGGTALPLLAAPAALAASAALARCCRCSCACFVAVSLHACTQQQQPNRILPSAQPNSQQAVVAHTAEAKVLERSATEAAPEGNGASTSSGNGAATAKVFYDDEATARAAPAAAAANGVSGNGSNGAAASSSNGNGAAAAAALSNGNGNGNGAAAKKAAADRALNTIDEDQNALAAGKLELAAVTEGAAAAAAAGAADGADGAAASAPRTAAGTPYANPGGNWSKFKSYGVLQRTIQIWAFAFAFAWKYFLLGQGWTYKGGKKGMTPEAVSARKSELAVWLREGLVKLGVSKRGGREGLYIAA